MRKITLEHIAFLIVRIRDVWFDFLESKQKPKTKKNQFQIKFQLNSIRT